MRRIIKMLVAAGSLPLAHSALATELPDAIAAPGMMVAFQVHGVGAQIYECTAVAGSGRLSWEFREPTATLIRDGRTVGRHYAGPTWDISAGILVGKLLATVPAPNPKDLPWLKLSVIGVPEEGPLERTTTIQRINTFGGVVNGACNKAGDFHSEPYSADYVFLTKQT